MEQITIAELHQRLKDEPGLHILDVREKEEFEKMNMGGRLFPLSELKTMDAAAIEDWKDDEIIVHCKSGKRSLEACLILQTLGFSKPVNLVGGIEAWRAAYGDQQAGAQ